MAKYLFTVISLCSAKPASNNCFCVLHPFPLMGAFAGRLKANGLIEKAFWCYVRSLAIYRAADESMCPINLQMCQSAQ